MSKLSSYRQILGWLPRFWKKFYLQAILNTLLGVAQVGLNLAFVWGTKLAIDVATTHQQGQAGLRSLPQCLMLLGGIMLVQVGLGFANHWVKAILGVRAQNMMQQLLFTRLLGSEWMGLRRYHSGDVLNRLLKDVGALVSLLTEDVPAFITTVCQFLGAFVFLYVMDRRLALIVVIIAPFFILVSKLYVRKMRRLTHEVRESDSHIQSLIQESIQHALVVKTLERVDFVGQRLSSAHHTFTLRVAEKTKYSSLSAMVMNLGFAAGYLFTFAWGVLSLQSGVITYGALLAFIQLVGQIQGPVRALSKYIPVFINASTACERLMELDHLPQEVRAPQSPHPGVPTLPDHMPDLGTPFLLRLEGVSFRYASKSRPILRDCSFDFCPGSITAVLGETGAGKTTLIRLLLALIRPTEGSVLLVTPDGCTRPLTASDRRLFAYVPQGNTLLSGTIRDNLLMGCPTATEEELHTVLHVAAADFVFNLPLGLDTPCSEMGGGLSEGQAQRIAIARGLLRPCPIFLFDESTSALDAQTEELVVERIVRFLHGRTLIFITHRPALLRFATQQIRLERQHNEPPVPTPHE